MAQSLVQLDAPPDKRGRVIGLFNMASLGLKNIQRHLGRPDRQPDRDLLVVGGLGNRRDAGSGGASGPALSRVTYKRTPRSYDLGVRDSVTLLFLHATLTLIGDQLPGGLRATDWPPGRARPADCELMPVVVPAFMWVGFMA